MNALLSQLSALATKHPRARKRLITPEISAARELIRTLAQHGSDTTGWEAANLRLIAEELSCVGARRRGLSPTNDILIASLINRAIDEVAAGKETFSGFERHAEGHGFREAVRNTVLELRTAGVSPAQISKSSTRELTRAAGAVLMKYEALLESEKLLDPAGIFRIALEDFDSEAPFVLQGLVAIAPGIKVSGLRGDLVKRLIAHGATLVAGDLPNGVTIPRRMAEGLATDVPKSDSPLSCLASGEYPEESSAAEVEVFAASTPYEEIREALRRALTEGCRLDDVELVTTDTETYGIALDAICERLGIGMTSLRGIPLRRTQIGRCFMRWMTWIADGLPADEIRAALENEELSMPGDSETNTTQLAPLFRTLQIGWGRERYEKGINELADGSAIRRLRLRDDEDSPENVAAKASAVANASHLRHLLRVLIKRTPLVPERGSTEEISMSPSDLATAALKYLELLRVTDDTDARSLAKLRARLDQIAESETKATSFALAHSAVEDGVSDLRAWSSVSGSTGVVSSQGGKIFLTDIANAGVTGRNRIFVVGLDAATVAGSQLQDPVLLDSERNVIDDARLASSSDRRDEKRFTLYRSLASLRGKVTLSFSVSGEDGRQQSPSHVLLEALRLSKKNSALGFRDLHLRLTPPSCAVPAGGTGVMDARDGWLSAIGAASVLADARTQVQAAFPGLAAGLEAIDLKSGTDLSAHHGLIPASAGKFDPRSSVDRVLSPSSFELMGRCPLAWFYKYGVEIAPPVDPEYSPEEWLNALDRGSLLHAVFEDFCRAFMGRQSEIDSADAEFELIRILDTRIAEWKVSVPPPNEIIYGIECGKLRAAVLSFLTMERELHQQRPAAQWREVEKAFGGHDDPSWYDLPDGSRVRIRGRIDRIDDSGNGTITVIDYKTGKSARYWTKRSEPPFKGGRQLQPSIYSEVVESSLGISVDQFEYRFPTEKGQNDIVPYKRSDLLSARPVIAGLLEHVSTGAFLPTTDGGDCRFCDYKSICRVRDSRFGATSPLADWAKENQSAHPEFDSMRKRRGDDE